MAIRTVPWVAALVVLSWLAVAWEVPAIEASLTERARERIVALGARDVEVEVRGRDAILTGAVRSAHEERRLLHAVEGVWGMRRVTSSVTRTQAPAARIGTRPEGPAPDGGAAPTPEPRAPEALPALDTPEARALTDDLAAVLADRRIEFEQGSAELTVEGQATLREVTALLRRAPALVVEIGGHTDDTGTSRFNLDLSRRRAQTVSDALELAGIDRSRLLPKGFGASRPRASNEAREGRAHNRRIEFRVIGETDP